MSNTGKIKILNPGLLSTIQDTGRWGYQQYGMPVAGAMDTDSMQLANWCVDNKPDTAVIETTLIGPTIEFMTDTTIALCGALTDAQINGEPVEMNCSLSVQSGDILEVGNAYLGCRTYLAIAGGFCIERFMNSQSTYLRGKLGGYQGRALKLGDQIPVNSSTQNLNQTIPEELLPEFNEITPIRIIAGTEVNCFSHQGIQAFLCSTYTISPQSDRMGYRLEGTPIEHIEGADIISSGLTTGTIQVPGHGEPIIMMADHQTTGGYTRIAHVITADLPLLGQMKPGDQLQFKEVSLEKAQDILIEKHKRYQKIINV
ncbi:biotin-dependent carboxyltransferase [Prolixibacteraceae bacterium JC049]|nr:biotin-dependent carboxyltransferase [Prolixibacteraceae bacterium JC049]